MESDRVRAPNIRDVARHAGVSHQTVSRVLNSSPRLSPQTRDRVLAAIDELGYRPNQAARALVTSRTRTIGVLSAVTVQYGPTTTVNAIEVAAREAGYRLSITSSPSSDADDLRASLDHLRDQSIDALVVIAPQVGVFDAIQELSIAVPFVTIEASGRDADHSLSVNQVVGARMATRHLIDLGHTRFAHVAGPHDWLEAEARLRGCRAELADAGLPAPTVIDGDWSAESGFHAGLQLLADRSITAVVAANDQMALGILHACRELSRAVPDELSVIGFDDIPEAAHFSPPLSTIRQDFAEIGRRTVENLIAQLEGIEPPARSMVTPELVVRSSTAGLPTAEFSPAALA